MQFSSDYVLLIVESMMTTESIILLLMTKLYTLGFLFEKYLEIHRAKDAG